MNQQNIEHLKDLVATAHRILHQQKLADYAGHVSARVPGTDKVLIKRLLISFQNVSPQDIVMTDMEGNLVEGTGRQPAEISLHCEIYKARSDVGSVIHTHQKWASAFGIAGRRILPVQHPGMASIVWKEIPVYESAVLITNAEQAKDVARIMGEHSVCHLRNHGMVIAGSTVEEATLKAINLERQAELNYIAAQLGTITAIPDEVMEKHVAWVKQADFLKQVKETGYSISGWDYYSGLV